jgi:hypothetical protein
LLYTNAVVNHSIRSALPEYYSQSTIDGELNPSDADISLEEYFESTIKNETLKHTQELLNFIDSEIDKLLLEASI